MEPVKNRKPRSFRKKQEILQLLNKYDQSGQSIKSFCAFHNIPNGTFHNWKHKYKNEANALPGFAPVQVIPSASTGLFAEVGGIKIYQPVSAAYLKELL